MLTLDQIDIGDVIFHPVAKLVRKVERVYAGRLEMSGDGKLFSLDEARLISCGWRMKKKAGYR